MLGADLDGIAVVPHEVCVQNADLVIVGEGEALYIPRGYQPERVTPVAVHLQPSGEGALVRIGDALNQDTRMRSVLARITTTDFRFMREESRQKDADV